MFEEKVDNVILVKDVNSYVELDCYEDMEIHESKHNSMNTNLNSEAYIVC